MKKLLTLILVFAAMSVQAADTDSLNNRRQDPCYIQLFGGINKSANENLPWTEFSSYPWSGGVFVAFGKEFSNLWGWRIAAQYNYNKSRNVPLCENEDTYGWHSAGAFADMTFDISDAFRKKGSTRILATDEPYKKWNTKLFGGLGFEGTWTYTDVPLSYTHPYSRSSKTVFGFRFGVNVSYQIARRWRIGAELTQHFFTDAFNGVAYDTPLDGRTNLGLGVTYLIAKKKKVEVAPIVKVNRLDVIPPLPFFMPDEEGDKMRQIVGRAFLDFPVSQMTIYPDYRKNPDELRKICASVDSALFDKSVVITKITLHGYASPESPYSNNTRLSLGRVKALKEYLMVNYDFNDEIFQLKNTPEDWGNLKNFIISCQRRQIKGQIWYDDHNFYETPEVPEIIHQYRDEMLAVIDNGMQPDDKEEALKRVGGGEPYKWLLQYVYPGLRHTDYVIEYKVKQFSLDKARKLIYTHPEGLSLAEMYRVANSYPESSDMWYEAYIIAAKRYPNDKTANMNAACACVKMRRLKDAQAYLDKVGESKDAEFLQDVINKMK